MLNFRQIEVFHAIMVARTVSGAARLLNVAQPGVSRTLRHTEDRLGFQLFDRLAGRLVPTRQAHELFAEVEAIHKRIEDLDLHIKRLERGQDMVFRVGAQPSAGRFIVPRALGALKRRCGELVIQFDMLSLQQVEDYLLSEDGEYTVGTFALDHPNIVSREIGTAPLVCVLPPAHRLSARDQVQVSDILDEPLISFRANTPHGAMVNAWFQDAGVERRVSTYVRFAETACDFVRHGLGVAVVDAFTAMGGTGAGLVIRPVAPHRRMPLYLHRNRFAARSMFADMFEAELIAALAEYRGAPETADRCRNSQGRAY